MAAVQLVVYSDYLCPWCYNAAVRLRRLQAEFGDALAIDWRAYLLRPRVDPNRTLEQFRAYTRSWLRPAAEPDAGTFRVWEGDAGPPSHSVPPHLVAKAAATLGPDAFDAVHERLLAAYFAENRDITDLDTLRAVWDEAGLPASAFTRVEDPALLRAVADEHNEAVERDVSGVPAVLLLGRDVPLLGAHPIELYRRWVQRALDEQAVR
jgi:predicted DsbA family dithiol-disulfide isomerase